MTERMTSQAISCKITGGIQVPHFHLDDHIVFPDRSKFQELVQMTDEKII